MNLNRILTLKMSGEDIKFLQTKLKEFGLFPHKIDGYFGQNTLISVVNFQKSVMIKSDGVVGPQTWSQLIHHNPANEVKPKIKEVKETASFIGPDGLKIYDHLLSNDEYYKEETSKNTIWLHHTGGGSRPDWTIGSWENDFEKDEEGNLVLDENGNLIPLRVATHFVIGRKSSSSSDNYWDGKILKAFNDEYWSYHLGVSKNSYVLNSKSIGIELCNYGPLNLKSDGQFYNWVNKPIKPQEVVELSKPFRGYKYWERYTDLQLENLRKLILHLINKWGIEYEKGIYNEDWFEYKDIWFNSGGLRSHTQVRKDKFDIFPQPELIQVLNSL